MPDYLNMPRQKGLSDNPVYVKDPRKFARTRCDKGLNALDRVIMNMGELIQVYSPPDKLPVEMKEEGLALIQFCKDNDLSLSKLIDLTSVGNVEIGTMGTMGGYIAIAALIMQTAEQLQGVIQELKSSI